MLKLFRREKTDLSRANRARRLGDRARNGTARRSPFLIEELETRVLLTGGGAQQSVHFFALDLPRGVADVAPQDRPGLEDLKDAPAIPGSPAIDPESGPANLVFLHVQMLDPTDPPTVIVVAPMIYPGASSENLDGVHASPAANEATVADPSQVGAATTPATAGGHYGPAAPGEANSGFFWQAEASSGSATSVALPNAGGPGGSNWPILPLVPHVQVPGTLDPDQTSMTFQIPVDPSMTNLALSIHDMGSGGEFADFGQMELVNQMGVPLAEVTPNEPGTGSVPTQVAMVYLKGAPVGGHLDVQVMASGSASGSASASESASPTAAGLTVATGGSSSWSVPFVLDVQRQETTTLAQDTCFSAGSQTVIGTLIAAASQTGGFVTSSSADATAAQDDEASSEAAAPGSAVAMVATATSTTEPEPFDSFNLRVATGPLASRSASPLGPTLASIDADATQPVDRHERALSQEIEGLGPDDAAQSAGWRSGPADQDLASSVGNAADSSESASTGGTVVAVAGRGGFPLKVTARGHGQQAQLAELWATLPSEAEPVTSVSSASPSPTAPPDVAPMTDPAQRVADPTEYPGIVKAACGLVVGLSLTSGPLFADLIAKLPRPIPKWLAPRRLLSAGDEAPASKRYSLRRVPAWLRGLLVRT